MLLYTADDVERQFGLAARSRLTRSEIDGISRALRNLKTKNDGATRGRDSEVVATPGEILPEDDEHSFRRDTTTDDTRIKTAIVDRVGPGAPELGPGSAQAPRPGPALAARTGGHSPQQGPCGPPRR